MPLCRSTKHLLPSAAQPFLFLLSPSSSSLHLSLGDWKMERLWDILKVCRYYMCNWHVCLLYFVGLKLLHRWSLAAQMGQGQFFIACSIWWSPAHLVCSEKHLSTNLFVTMYWRHDLSSCHALVAAWCLKTWLVISFRRLATGDSLKRSRLTAEMKGALGKIR